MASIAVGIPSELYENVNWLLASGRKNGKELLLASACFFTSLCE